MKKYHWIVVVVALLFIACKSNPLMQLDASRLLRFVHANDRTKVAPLCAKYYVEGSRAKVTRISTVCSEWTRMLAENATKMHLIEGTKITPENFREKRLWKKWIEEQKKAEQQQQ